MTAIDPGPNKNSQKKGILSSVRQVFRLKFKRKASTFEESVTELIREHDHDTSVHSEEKVILNNIVSFGDKEAGDIMTPRSSLIAASVDDPIESIKEKFLNESHTRLPLYKGNIDNIIGLLHIKDVFKALSSGKKFLVKDLAREVLFVPSSIKVTDLLAKMKQSAFHMAVVLDEYGATDGILTIEDVVEEIVGEINDEHDALRESNKIVQDGDAFIVDATAPIEESEANFGNFADDNHEYDTFGGYLITKLGRIPTPREIFEFGNLKIEVLEANSRRVLKLRVNLLKPSNS